MSYHKRPRALAGDMTHGPSWYRAMEGVSTQFPTPLARRPRRSLGSLGDDPNGGTTLDKPTITDPTFQWQADVLAQLRAGVATMRTAELQKWLQIVATLSIPLAAAVWRMIAGSLRRSGSDPTV